MNRAVTVSLLQRCFEAFNRGDHAVVLACVADDVAHDVNDAPREIGKERFRWFLALRARHFRDRLSDIVIMTDEGGGHAAAEFTLRGKYVATLEGFPRADDQGYSLPVGVFLEVDEGLVTRVSIHFKLSDLIAQLSRR